MVKSVADVRQFVSQLTIFDAILHCENTWDATSPETIVKCFGKSGVYDSNGSPLPPPPPHSLECGSVDDGDSEFGQYFQNLLGIPWDEYLMMDEELEAENPCCAPDANSYNDHIQDLPHQDQDTAMEAMPTPEELLESLKNVQRFVLGNTKLFELTEQLMVGIQKLTVEKEISNKSKQSTTSFFKS